MKIDSLTWTDGLLEISISSAQDIEGFRLSLVSDDASRVIQPASVDGPDDAGQAKIVFPGEFILDPLPVDQIVLEGLAAEHVLAGPSLFGDGSFSLRIVDDADYAARAMLRDQKYSLISRTGSLLGDFLMSAQVQSNDAICREYKSGAAVIMAYKAIELREPALRKAARKAIIDNLAHNRECGTDWHPRRNREHLRGSLACAQWHLVLMEPEVTIEDLCLLLEEETQRAPQLRRTFTPAYPLCMSLLLYVYLLLISDRRDRANEVSIIMFELFKRCVTDSKLEQTTLFHEISKVHDCVSMAARLVRYFEKYETGKIEKEIIAKIFRCPTEADIATKTLLRLRA